MDDQKSMNECPKCGQVFLESVNSCPNCEIKVDYRPSAQNPETEKLICWIFRVPDRSHYSLLIRLYDLQFTNKRIVGIDLHKSPAGTEGDPGEDASTLKDSEPLGTFYKSSFFDKEVAANPETNFSYTYDKVRQITLHDHTLRSTHDFPAQIEIEFSDNEKRSFGLSSREHEELLSKLQKIPGLTLKRQRL